MSLPTFDTTQFAGSARQQKAVNVRFAVGGEIQSSGIAYEDYARMRTVERAPAPNRHLPTPKWAVNDTLLREVLIVYLERRAWMRRDCPQAGTLTERLHAAEARIRELSPNYLAILKSLQARFVQLKDSPAERVRVAIQIKNIDSSLMMTRQPAATVARVVYLYYRTGLDSVGVAGEMGLQPPHVRQIISRMRKVATALGYDNQPPEIHRPVTLARMAEKKKLNAERRKAKLFAGLLEGMTWQQAKTAMGEPKTHNNKFRILLKKFGLWKPRRGRLHVEEAIYLRGKGWSFTKLGQRYGVKPDSVAAAISRQQNRAGRTARAACMQ